MAAPTVTTLGNAKPQASGGIRVGALGSTLPTDTETEPDAALAALGYVNEDGLRPEGERNVETIRDWGGDVIAQLQTEHSSRFVFTLYNVFDADVLKAVFGPENVSVGANGLLVVKEDGSELPHSTWLFDMRASGGKRVRIAVPDGQVTTVAEQPLVSGSLQAFEVTVEAFKDADGNKVYRYYEPEPTAESGSGDASGASTPVETPASLDF